MTFTIRHRIEIWLRNTLSHWLARWFCLPEGDKRLYVKVAVVCAGLGMLTAFVQVFVLGW